MNISDACSEDLPQILALQKRCYIQEAQIYNDFEIPPLTQTLESLSNDLKSQSILKMQSGENIIGSVRAYTDNGTCKIGRLIVHEDFQNQGLGRQLMKAIEKKFDLAQRFELFTGHKSLKNLGLYTKLGYVGFDKKEINDQLTLIFLEKFNIR